MLARENNCDVLVIMVSRCVSTALLGEHYTLGDSTRDIYVLPLDGDLGDLLLDLVFFHRLQLTI